MDKELKIKIRVDAKTGEIKVVGDQFERLESRIGRTSKATTLLKTSLAGIAIASAGAIAAIKPLTDTFREFETLSANIAKTTGLGLGSDELKKLTGELDTMATTMSGMKVQDLYEIAEGAGQLGIEKDKIAGFTKEIKMLQMTTDLTASEASTGFARIANALSEPIEDINKLASTFNELSNNSTATVRDLMSFTSRMAPVARGFGLTTSEVVGLSGALKDMNINFEVGGTAMNKLMGKMQSDTALFAQQIGVPFEEFQRVLKEKPMQALEMFSQKLNSLSAGDKYRFLDALSFSGTETQAVLLNVANNLQKVKTNIDTANEGYISGISHVNEYNQASQTIDNRIIQLGSSFDVLKSTIGSVFKEGLADSSESMIQFFNDTNQYILQNKEEWIENFQQVWEYISSGLTTVGEMMATFFNFVGSNIDTILYLGEAFVYFKAGSWLVSGISMASRAMDMLGNSTSLAGNKASTAGGKFSRLLGLMSKIGGKKILGIAGLLTATAFGKEADLKTGGRIKEVEKLIQQTAKDYNNVGIDFFGVKDDYIQQIKDYSLELYKLKTTGATSEIKKFKSAADDATNSVTKLGKVSISAKADEYKPVSFSPTNKLFTSPAKTNPKKIKSTFANEMRVAKKTAQQKANYAEGLHERYIKSINDKYGYDEHRAKKQYAQDLSRGLNKFQAETVYQDRIAGIEQSRYDEAERSAKRVTKTKEEANKPIKWGQSTRNKVNNTIGSTSSSATCVGGNCGKQSSFIDKATSNKYASQAGESFYGQVKKGFSSDEKHYKSIGSIMGDGLSSSLSGLISKLADGGDPREAMGSAMRGFAENAVSGMKNSGDPTMVAIGHAIDFARIGFNQFGSEIINLKTDLYEDNVSIANAIDSLGDAMNPQLPIYKSMNKHLESLDNNFQRIAVNIASSMGVNYTGKNFEGGISGLGGNQDNFLSALAGGIYSKETSLKKSGIIIAEQTIGSIMESIEAESYNLVNTKKSYLGGFFSSEKDKMHTQDLDAKTKNLLQKNMTHLFDMIGDAGDSLNIDTEFLRGSKLKEDLNFNFKDMSPDEVAAELSAKFGGIFDELAHGALKNIEDYMTADESGGDTFVRVASQYEQAKYQLSQLGLQADNFSEIVVDSLGKFDLDTLKQSTIQAHTGNIRDWIKEFDQTADSFVSSYKTVTKFNIAMGGFHKDMILGAGSIEALDSGAGSFRELFYDKQEQSLINWKLMGNEFDRLGIAVPKTESAFRELVDSQRDIDPKLYGKLLTLAQPYKELIDAQKELLDAEKKLTAERLSGIEEARDLIFSNTGINNIFKLNYAESLYNASMKNKDLENIKKYSQKTTDLMNGSQYGIEAQNRMLAIVNDTQRVLGNDVKVQEVTDKELAKKVDFLIKETENNTTTLIKIQRENKRLQPTGTN